jgi:hypothetical protein
MHLVEQNSLSNFLNLSVLSSNSLLQLFKLKIIMITIYFNNH